MLSLVVFDMFLKHIHVGKRTILHMFKSPDTLILKGKFVQRDMRFRKS